MRAQDQTQGNASQRCMSTFQGLLLVLGLGMAAAANAFPADFSFSASLASDDDQKSYFFTLAQQQTVEFRTRFASELPKFPFPSHGSYAQNWTLSRQSMTE